jgi:uncharacterized membrane protein
MYAQMLIYIYKKRNLLALKRITTLLTATVSYVTEMLVHGFFHDTGKFWDNISVLYNCVQTTT